METPYHIVFCLSYDFIPYLGVTLKSILNHHSKDDLVIHILHNETNDQISNYLLEFDSSFKDLNLYFYKVNLKKFESLKKGNKYAWMRLLIPEVLDKNIHYALYLDVDVLICDNLRSLFNLNLKSTALAAVIDPLTFSKTTFERCQYPINYQYICAGIMYLNLDFWRNNKISEKIFLWAKERDGDVLYADQDGINTFCFDKKVLLPLKYGVMDWFFSNNIVYEKHFEELKEAFYHPVIIHFAGCAPWLKDINISCFKDKWVSMSKKLKEKPPILYKSQGINKYKVMIWNLFHKSSRYLPSREEIAKRLESHGTF